MVHQVVKPEQNELLYLEGLRAVDTSIVEGFMYGFFIYHIIGIELTHYTVIRSENAELENMLI